MIKFWCSWILWKLKLAKNYRLAQEADKDKVYGFLKEFTRNPTFWRHSDVGREYCHLTEEGKEIMVNTMQDLLRTIDILERKALDQRAKEIVFDTLKGKE